ncbi:hypothetical protein J5I95_07995 [Candidatus Poribacteria bacterium]|nr:hypothetical protein [Candidatus Poribacteria bacterium]
MNRRNFLNTGDMVIGRFITAKQLGHVYTNPEQELTRILRTFSSKDILVTLARINLLFHRSTNLLSDERKLKEAYCSIPMLNKIYGDIGNSFLFHRQATLRLLNKCACVARSDSERSFDRNDALNDFSKSYLLVSELLEAESSARNMTGDTEKKDLLVKSFAFMEYSVNSSPAYETKKLMVRSEELLRRLQEHTSELNVNEIFSQVTGLTLHDYQQLVFGVFTFYWSFTSEEIGRQDPIIDRSLFFNPNGQSPELTPLYEKLLSHICISMDELRNSAEEHPKFADEFLLWREYPILKISEDRTICVDFSFLLDKLQTGVFWTIRGYLKEKKMERGIFEKLWGDVFEDYASSIIKRGIYSQDPSNGDKLIVNPKYHQKQQDECTDIAICCDNTLILMECKATILSAQAKFSGDFNIFNENIKSAKKGIKQLWNAILKLGNRRENKRAAVQGIDIRKVKKIYPVLVLSDQIFSTLLMSWFLDSEFQSLKQQKYLMEDLKVMPLTILTIMDLESLEPYMIDKPFHAHLDEWLNLFKEKDVSVFRSYLYPLMMDNPREHSFMDQRFAQITSGVQRYFSSRGIS